MIPEYIAAMLEKKVREMARRKGLSNNRPAAYFLENLRNCVRKEHDKMLGIAVIFKQDVSIADVDVGDRYQGGSANVPGIFGTVVKVHKKTIDLEKDFLGKPKILKRIPFGNGGCIIVKDGKIITDDRAWFERRIADSAQLGIGADGKYLPPGE
jgi:hypothetical protein